ncbi:unnamed protein product, partial [Fusarium langsethiae]
MPEEPVIFGNQSGSQRSQNNPEPFLFLSSPSAPYTNFLPPPPLRSARTSRSVRSRQSSAPQPQLDPHLRNMMAPEQPQQVIVIDLTEEPDSPVQSRVRPVSAQRAQISGNPRRTNSQRVSPSQLAWTDGVFVRRQTNIIDLTADSPEEGRFSPRYPHDGRLIAGPDELIERERIRPRPARGPIYGSES